MSESGDPSKKAPEVAKEYSEEGGLELLRRFDRGEADAERELVLQLNRLLHRVYVQRWSRSGLRFLELRGDCFMLLGEWRETGRLPHEPLPHLAQRLMKQCGTKQARERQRDQGAIRIDQGWETPPAAWSEDDRGRQAALEAELSRQNGPNPEGTLARKELAAWLVEVRERLSPSEQETYDAERKVADDEAKSLAEALGVSDEAARQRRHRMRKAIVALAEEDGLDDLVQWAAGRRTARKDKKEGS